MSSTTKGFQGEFRFLSNFWPAEITYENIVYPTTENAYQAGLIGVLATHARINSYGFVETPFYRVIKGRVLLDSEPIYLTADQEDDSRSFMPN